MNLPFRGAAGLIWSPSFRGAKRTRNLRFRVRCFASPRNDGGLASTGNPLDEQIENRLGGPLGLGAAHPPARKMTVDVHPGEAINQRPAGDLDLFDVARTELARRKRLCERAFGQLDQLGIVAGDAGGFVVVEKPAAGDDLEMGRVAHRPAQIGQAQTAEARQRIARRRFSQGRLDLLPEPPLGFLGHRLHQGVAARKMPERRPRRDPGAAGGLADADRIGATLPDQL